MESKNSKYVVEKKKNRVAIPNKWTCGMYFVKLQQTNEKAFRAINATVHIREFAIQSCCTQT